MKFSITVVSPAARLVVLEPETQAEELQCSSIKGALASMGCAPLGSPSAKDLIFVVPVTTTQNHEDTVASSEAKAPSKEEA